MYDLPSILYMYCSREASDLVLNRRLRLSRNLNDPSDLEPCVDGFDPATQQYEDWRKAQIQAKVQNAFIYVSCLSETWDSNLMWSHYADRHRGFVVGLRTEGGIVQGAASLKKVVYTSERPPNSDVASLYTKSNDWAYEREWRIIVQSNVIDVTRSESRQHLYRALKPGIVAEIIFGEQWNNTKH